MSKTERKILIGLLLAVVMMACAVCITFYITRIQPINEAARQTIFIEATRRAMR
jgi:hypothetical protein